MAITQEDYVEFNQYNSQLSVISSQKTQLKMVLESIVTSIEEVDKSETKEVYKNLGNILIKTTKESIKKDLKNEMETIDVRLKTLDKQEDIVSKKVESLKAKLESKDE